MKSPLVFIAAFGFSVCSAFSADVPLLTLEKSVPLPGVKGGFDLMAVDVSGNRLFLCAEDNDSLEVIDLASGQRLRSVAGFHGPKWAVYRPEQQRIYVSNSDGQVTVLDARTFAPIKEFAFREKANNLRFDPATQELIVGIGKNFGALACIDTAKDVVTGEIPLADFPKQFEIEGDRIFVNVPKSNHVAVVSRKSRKVETIWPVAEAKDNVPMGFDRAQHRLFIGCEPGKLIVFDTTTGKTVASLDIAEGSDGIHFDAKRHQIYISCGAGSVDVVTQIDADHYTLSGRIPTLKGAATSWYTPELDVLCLAVPQQDGHPAELRIYRPAPVKK